MGYDKRAQAVLLCLAFILFMPLVGRSAPPAYVQHNLVSNIPGLADHTDPDLKNPWGITFRPPAGVTPGSPFWISDNNAGVSTLYNGLGAPIAALPNVTIPAPSAPTGGTPTGIVFNLFAGSGAFVIPGTGAPALFIFDTEDGTIVAWNAAIPDPDVPAEVPPDVVPADDAKIVVDNSAGGGPTGAVYKGLALGVVSAQPFLYASNFRSGKIDVFDSTFAPATLSGNFSDPNLPKGYAPFGVQNIGGNLYVTYAVQDAPKHDPVNGPAHGIVDIFDSSGNFMRRFVTHGLLNSPWGVVRAPASFGRFASDILIGNFGNGRINAYDPVTAEFQGNLRNPDNSPIVNDGLWALTFGGALLSSPNTLYFTAGLNGEQDGLFGAINPE
jgi:uncharacterized protein (TIGR03118 family)